MNSHDNAACLVNNAGEIVAFHEEERFSRKKHSLGQLPVEAIRECLNRARIGPSDVEIVAIGWDLPRIKSQVAANRRTSPPWAFDNRSRLLTDLMGLNFGAGRGPDLVFVSHHLAHAISALYASPFKSAAVLVIDGSGEDESISIFEAHRGRWPILRRQWPIAQSLGCMYEAAGLVLGFGLRNGGKTMGLASFGRAASVPPWPILKLASDDFECVAVIPHKTNFDESLAIWQEYFHSLLPRPITKDLDVLDTDDLAIRLAWSVQDALESVVEKLVLEARRITGLSNVCLAGGVALNCAANARVSEPVFVPPVPHDAGVALGAAWLVSPPVSIPERGMSPYLGWEVTESEIRSACLDHSLHPRPFTPGEIADRLLRGQIGAIVEAQAEVGPRALCHRSILAFPSPASVRLRVNRLKGREPWRPLAPVTLKHVATRYWETKEHLSRYMLASLPVYRDAVSFFPAVVHVDATTRAQVLHPGESIIAESILREMEADFPVLMNTSFNGRNQPIVNSAKDAIEVFLNLDLDFVVMNDDVIEKS